MHRINMKLVKLMKIVEVLIAVILMAWFLPWQWLFTV